MDTKASRRKYEYITHPMDDKAFEQMCQHIYSESYHSPGIRLFGRRGQGQNGIDILLNDYNRNSRKSNCGMVLVQCKETKKDELAFADLYEDIEAVEALKKVRPEYSGVYLMVIATNAKNDSRLHKRLQAFKTEQDLSFEIELHTWDTLCSKVVASDRLWELYSSQPDRPVPVEFRSAVIEKAREISSFVNCQRLGEAFRVDNQRRSTGQTNPVYGYPVPKEKLPVDIWKNDFELRMVLIDFYTKAADSPLAVPLLEYEFNLGEMREARQCLDYFLALRVAGQMMSPTSGFAYVGDRPDFIKRLETLTKVICQTKGSADELGCLALLLVMETENNAIQDAGIKMLQQLVEHDIGTRWENESRVAYSVVRYFYLQRRGWTPLVCKYAVGDTPLNRPFTTVEFGDKRLNEALPHQSSLSIWVMGTDPLEPECASVSVPERLIMKFEHFSNSVFGNSALKRLFEQCQIYGQPKQSVRTINCSWRTNVRESARYGPVSCADTLLELAANGTLDDVLFRYQGIKITERTLERILGRRAVVRANVERSGEATFDKSNIILLKQLNSLIDSCRIAVGSSSCKGISVCPVYDNPPLRPIAGLNEIIWNSSRFTLTHDSFQLAVNYLTPLYGMGLRSPIDLNLDLDLYDKYCQLEKLYSIRTDEFSLACLLALHVGAPLLTYQYNQHLYAHKMGIGTERPDLCQNVI